MTVLNYIWTFLSAHQVIVTLIFAQAVNSLPMPDSASNPFYRWFFSFVTSLPNLMRSAASMGPHGQKAPAPKPTPTPITSFPPKP
jgi:hypothetical protein